MIMWMGLWQSGVALAVWKWLGLVGVDLLNGHEGEVEGVGGGGCACGV